MYSSEPEKEIKTSTNVLGRKTIHVLYLLWGRYIIWKLYDTALAQDTLPQLYTHYPKDEEYEKTQ